MKSKHHQSFLSCLSIGIGDLLPAVLSFSQIFGFSPTTRADVVDSSHEYAPRLPLMNSMDTEEASVVRWRII